MAIANPITTIDLDELTCAIDDCNSILSIHQIISSAVNIEDAMPQDFQNLSELTVEKIQFIKTRLQHLSNNIRETE